jgi:prepilin-type N-terminal cleavage/methylation domain-containing protein
MNCRPGFTLLETLVAVALLSLLAAAAVPLVQHLGRGELHLSDRWTARTDLLNLLSTHALPADGQPDPGHAGWWIRVHALIPDAAADLANSQTASGLPHRWFQVAISSGPTDADIVLAETLVADLLPVPVQRPAPGSEP